ncbi:MAG: DNA adenine methylase [Terriglobia bacterium]
MKVAREHSEVFCDVSAEKIVNVATVPQRSPFRYPGGKTWLVPYIRLWLSSIRSPVPELIEPFAGGAIVGLTAAFENLARIVTLVELDSDVAAVWETILNGGGKKLAERIADFELNAQNVRRVLASSNPSPFERAFITILRNRVQRGGILASGAGLMKSGENGKGLASRWYPQTLRNRILAILEINTKIKFVHGDGLDVLRRNAKRKDVAYFIDPPYTVAGSRLYTHSEMDHEALFRLVDSLAGDFLMTYDNAEEIRLLADKFRFDLEPVPMKNTHHAKMTELLIGRNLDWARERQYSELVSPGFLTQRFRG